ncbi:hypothetical protein [Sedimenticola hydrogenitrophicus]|uniref:hypothetical protein n=1 Tax=Sedimenticola hydrogenitrophicus TaxID=2967975 RepID=UPI0023B18978|nr:hypothetical protein [Sedimenticola hydrogenitrophicus]
MPLKQQGWYARGGGIREAGTSGCGSRFCGNDGTWLTFLSNQVAICGKRDFLKEFLSMVFFMVFPKSVFLTN